MANFAVIEYGIVTNTLIAESKESAEDATGKSCVEYTESNVAYIGLGYSKGVFEQPVFDEDPNWVPPTQPK